MKTINDPLIRVCFFSLGILTPLLANAQRTPFYVQADIGGNVTLDTDLESFFGPVAPGSKVKFDPGVTFGLTGGYQVTRWFAVEVTTGVMANWVDSITDATWVDNVSLSNIPFLANIRLQIPWRRVNPYIGGGVGGSTSIIDADHLEINGITLEGSDADVVFAYQGFAGVRFNINSQMGVSVEYRYFATDSPTWHATSATGSDSMSFGGAQTHSLSAAFTYRF